jgi:hypothetical protein
MSTPSVMGSDIGGRWIFEDGPTGRSDFVFLFCVWFGLEAFRAMAQCGVLFDFWVVFGFCFGNATGYAGFSLGISIGNGGIVLDEIQGHRDCKQAKHSIWVLT